MDSLYNLFVDVCKEHGDETAIIYQDQAINYKTVYANVEKIYNKLIKSGIKARDVVGLSMRRTPNVIATMLAILRIGATYMPFNPLQKKMDWCRMIEESGCKIVVNDWQDIDRFFEGNWIELEEFDNELSEEQDFKHVQSDYSKNNLYIIYTSGSTGKSKGVGIRQESLRNLILYGTKEIGLVRGESIVAVSNFAFDMSVPETIMAILIGMTILMLNDIEVVNPRLIRRQIQRHSISTLLITPTRMNIILDCKKGTEFLKSIKNLLFGAEMISLTLIERLKEATDAQIFNLYGPTETTAYLTYSNITNKEVVDIGLTIKNTEIHLVDSADKIIDGPGEGEIVISGIGVADGYISEDKKKSFKIYSRISEGKVYYTGDIAKRLDNGDIVYLGRGDNQVKYRGYRLGLEDIEDKIRNCIKEIRDCVVCVYKDEVNEYLALVYVSSEKINISDFKSRLSDYLANYAIPISLIKVESMPLNRNGKIERAKVADLVNDYYCKD